MLNKLRELGIYATHSGKFKCPSCTPTRKNKADRSLSVTFEEDSVLYCCHNVGCGFEGVIFDSDSRNRQDIYIPKKVYTRPEVPQVSTQTDKMETWFNGRGISKDTLTAYKIAYNGKQILFNYFKDGELVNIKYRDGRKNFRQEKNAEKTFYGMDVVPEESKELIIVEGEIDVLSFYEVGIKNAVSVPQGGGENRLECIDNCLEFLDRFNSFVLATDTDETGLLLRDNLLIRLGKERCKIVDWSVYPSLEKCKDANDVLMLGEKEALKESIKQAKFIPINGICNFNSFKGDIMNFYYNGYSKGCSTGWKSLDEFVTIKKKYLMVVTGIPSRGKSFFTDSLLHNLYKKYGWKSLLFSFENTRENYFARLAEFHTGKQFGNCEERYKIQPEQLYNTIDELSQNFFIYDNEEVITVDEILKKAQAVISQKGLDCLVIDPYNRLSHDMKGEREDIYIGKFLSKLSAFAKKNNILVIVVAHPTKIGTSKDSPDVPSMYHISGSANWYNMADYGIVIHRDRNPDGRLESLTKVIVSKVKDYHIGDPSGGEVHLEYDFKTRKLEDIYEEEKTVLYGGNYD